MAKKEKEPVEQQEQEAVCPEEKAAEAPEEEKEAPDGESKALQEKLEREHELNLRLAAEYDNFRKRTQKEKEQSYDNGKSDAIAKLLPVYDNLERALQQETSDAAYKKGVEMTMTELQKILSGLGVTIFGQVGDSFDPNLHNAVMHTENEELGENVISQVFQKGFRLGDKIIRFAMVQAAN